MPIPGVVKDYLAQFMSPEEIAAQEKALEDKGRDAVASGVAFKGNTGAEAPQGQGEVEQSAFTEEQTKQITEAIEYAIEFTVTPLMDIIEKMATDIQVLSQNREFAFREALETTPRASLKARLEGSNPIGNPATRVDGRTTLGRAHPEHAERKGKDKPRLVDNVIVNDVLTMPFDDVMNGDFQ